MTGIIPDLQQTFFDRLREQDFPNAHSATSLADIDVEPTILLNIFESQWESRCLDNLARKLRRENQGFYTIGSSGHEGNAVFGQVFRQNDMAFLHYRSAAFMLQRYKRAGIKDAVADIIKSLVASASDPISGGRHKVLGSVECFIPPQTSTIASHLPKAVGAAMAISRSKALNVSGKCPHDSIIICSFGDASVNHASAQTAFNTAQNLQYQHFPLPLIFICEDNGLGISVPTPTGWISENFQQRLGLHYIAVDGLNVCDVYRGAKQAEHISRTDKKPVFLHMHCKRLLGHAGSDIETEYREIPDIESDIADDPLLHTARILIENKLASSQELLDKVAEIATSIDKQANDIINLPKLSNAKQIMTSIIPLPRKVIPRPLPLKAEREQHFAKFHKQFSLPRNLNQSINLALMDLLLQYPNAIIFGEDVGRKGGVYHVTANLQATFGSKRVFDSLLDETTILGTAIGFAHNDLLPIPEIQFLAYFHNAEDQLRGEAATLSFFSNGQYSNPMVVRIPGLAYQKGFGGHFHNDNSIAVLRDIPGVIIACPSNGSDAARMLRTCVKLAYEQGRVVVFLEPIALYMTKDLTADFDNLWLSNYPDPNEMIDLDEINVHGESTELAIISFANGYYLSRQAQAVLSDQHQLNIKVIDLRWLAPLPWPAMIKAVENCKRILIVDETRRTGSLSEGLMTGLLESLNPLPMITRLTGLDSFIPLGDACQYVLPSRDDIITECLRLCETK